MNQRQVWSTTQAQGNGLGYWVEAICEAFLKMSADSTSGRQFSGRLEQHPLGPLELNFIDADPQEVWRTKRDIGRSTENHFYLLHIRRERLIALNPQRQATSDMARPLKRGSLRIAPWTRRSRLLNRDRCRPMFLVRP